MHIAEAGEIERNDIRVGEVAAGDPKLNRPGAKCGYQTTARP